MDPITITGRFRRLIWQAEEDDALIGVVLLPDGSEATVKGPPPLAEGLDYRLVGSWERHPKYGQQFAYVTASAIPPHDRRGVIAYLKETAEGIGQKRAERLWDTFGADAVQILREQPDRVVEAGICGPEVAHEASNSLNAEAGFEPTKIDLLSLFHGRGFQVAKLIRQCLLVWRTRAPELLRRNPWLLLLAKAPYESRSEDRRVVKIEWRRGFIGCGFLRVDRLHCDLGGRRSSLKRQALCAWHRMRSDSSGHTWHPAARIVHHIKQTIPEADPIRALQLAIRARLLVCHRHGGDVWLAETRKAHHEAVVADKVREMLTS